MYTTLIIAVFCALASAVAVPPGAPVHTPSPKIPSVGINPPEPTRISRMARASLPDPLASIFSEALHKTTPALMPPPPIVTSLPPVVTALPTQVQGNPALDTVLSAILGAPTAPVPSGPAAVQAETEKKLMNTMAALMAVEEDMLYNTELKNSLEAAAGSVGQDLQSQFKYQHKLASVKHQISYDEKQEKLLQQKVGCLSWMVQPHKAGDEMPIYCMGLGPL